IVTPSVVGIRAGFLPRGGLDSKMFGIRYSLIWACTTLAQLYSCWNVWSSLSMRMARSWGVVLLTNMVTAWLLGMITSDRDAIVLHRLAKMTKSSSGFIFSITSSNKVGD